MPEHSTNSFARRSARIAFSAMLAVSVAGCGHSSPMHLVTHMFGPSPGALIGTVAADEPQAVMVGRDILSRGGNAADAAAAMGMALAVTLPSRASMGSGGACLAYRPGDTEGGRAFIFTPRAGTVDGIPGAPHADRPAAVPMLARGMYLMHLQYGTTSFAAILPDAMSLAVNGVNVSHQLASDLATVQGPLLADPGMRAIFSRTDGTALVEGDALVQTHLSGVLDQIRGMGVGDLYNGALAQSFTAGSQAAGGGLQTSDLRAAIPSERLPLRVNAAGGLTVAFLPPPADGGLGSAVAFRALLAGQGNPESLSQGAVAAWRARGGDTQGKQTNDDLTARAQAVLDSGTPGSGSLPSLPASTSFAVVDHAGMAVACSLTMNNLFGTGRIAGNTGIVLAASPARVPAPLLSAAIANDGHAFRAAVAGSGQNDAAAAVAEEMKLVLSGQAPASRAVTAEGRVNAIACPRGLPGDGMSCVAGSDPRETGLAVGPR